MELFLRHGSQNFMLDHVFNFSEKGKESLGAGKGSLSK